MVGLTVVGARPLSTSSIARTAGAWTSTLVARTVTAGRFRIVRLQPDRHDVSKNRVWVRGFLADERRLVTVDVQSGRESTSRALTDPPRRRRPPIPTGRVVDQRRLSRAGPESCHVAEGRDCNRQLVGRGFVSAWPAVGGGRRAHRRAGPVRVRRRRPRAPPPPPEAHSFPCWQKTFFSACGRACRSWPERCRDVELGTSPGPRDPRRPQ
jgi:hypothetical protein